MSLSDTADAKGRGIKSQPHGPTRRLPSVSGLQRSLVVLLCRKTALPESNERVEKISPGAEKMEWIYHLENFLQFQDDSSSFQSETRLLNHQHSSVLYNATVLLMAISRFYRKILLFWVKENFRFSGRVGACCLWGNSRQQILALHGRIYRRHECHQPSQAAPKFYFLVFSSMRKAAKFLASPLSFYSHHVQIPR